MKSDTCIFRGLVMPNPFHILCSDPVKGLKMIGHTIDREFFISNYRKNIDSEEVVERQGYLLIEYIGPSANAIYPPLPGSYSLITKNGFLESPSSPSSV